MKPNKHASYRRLPNRLARQGTERTSKYFEDERFAWLTSHVDLKEKHLLDIGCNTGFFIFEALDYGARSAVGYEGSTPAQSILEEVIRETRAPVDLRKSYFEFDSSHRELFDICFLFNVIHHLGDDYGERIPNNDLRAAMLENVNSLATYCGTLVLQFGFNLHGNVLQPIFPNGLKHEMIQFIRSGTVAYWDEIAIGVADRTKAGKVIYSDLDSKNIARRDDLGEFLNRPIFILKSRLFSTQKFKC